MEVVVRTGQYRIRVRSWGAGSLHAVVLPGLGATFHTLAPQVRLLCHLGYKAHVVELPGFGLPPPLRPEDASFPRLADHVTAATEALGIDHALFLGHSLGGGIALHVALRRPTLVDGLVLLAPAAVGRSLHWIYKLWSLPLVGRALLRPPSGASAAVARRFLIGRRRRDDDAFVDLVLHLGHATVTSARSTRAIVDGNQPRALKKLALLLVPGGEQSAFTLGPRLAELEGIPTLVLWGADDRVISARDALRFHAPKPQAEVHVARGVGHMLPLEAPAWIDRHIARFLEQEQLLARPQAA